MFPGETLLSAQEEKDPHYSDLLVLQSAAGFYLGSTWAACSKENCGSGCSDEYDYLTPEARLEVQEPGSRETDYFATEEEADEALKKYRQTGKLDRKRI